MLLLLVVLAAGAAAGFLRGGRLRRLASLRFRSPSLLVGALAAQLSLGHLPAGWRLPIVLASYAAVGVWIARNVRHQPRWVNAALALVAAGWACNLAAIVPNGGMPVSREALSTIGVPSGYDVAAGHLYKHVDRETAAALGQWLGDVIPVPALGAVVSAGDILLAAGIAMLVAIGMAGTTTPCRSTTAGAPAALS